jgi:hypothetical protein
MVPELRKPKAILIILQASTVKYRKYSVTKKTSINI